MAASMNFPDLEPGDSCVGENLKPVSGIVWHSSDQCQGIVRFYASE